MPYGRNFSVNMFRMQYIAHLRVANFAPMVVAFNIFAILFPHVATFSPLCGENFFLTLDWWNVKLKIFHNLTLSQFYFCLLNIIDYNGDWSTDNVITYQCYICAILDPLYLDMIGWINLKIVSRVLFLY